MRRGDVWWADLPAPVGRRPIVLISRDRAYASRNAVTVAYLTTTVRGIPVEVPLGPADGLPKPCVANLDVINTIPKSAIVTYICTLSATKMIELDRAARYALGL
jgi:mRNA interferase MazF